MCSGGASLSPEDRVELLAILAGDADDLISERARAALLSPPIEAFLNAVARPNTAPQLFSYCAQNLADRPGMADALASNPHCPVEILAPLAGNLTTTAVQVLMEDLERLSTSPALVVALAHSTSLTAEQQHQLQELQQGAGDPAALEEALIEAEPNPTKRQTLLEKLARMRVVERVQLALKGNREDRLYLIRDPCKVVQRAVLQSPRISDREVEAFAAMASLSDEVLRLIARNRLYMKNYTVVHSLMNNPKTPLDISLHLLPSLNPQDLKKLTMNRNLSDTLRTAALRLQRKRAELRRGAE